MNVSLPRQRHRLGFLAIACAAASAVSSVSGALPMLHNDGPKMVDPAGHPVLLKGCNLGNTLMLESWMFGDTLVLDGKPFRDGAAIYRKLRERFGDEKFDQLWDVYRTSYVTARDFQQVKSFGFNVVRLPFDYRLLQRDVAPYGLKPNAFKYLDHIVALAADAGVYVILDLHGTPGGQSGQDHTGEAGQNHLWGDPVNRGRTATLWHDLAEHFKGNGTVAAYDLINEPYGDYHTDMRPELATLMPELYGAVRSTGDQHVVFFSGALNGGTNFYGDPRARGMTGVGLTEHYYPGLFGSPSTLENQAQTLNGQLRGKQAQLARLQAPYFVGEFNIVEKAEWPERMMRAYEDKFAEYGWLSTLWSYKLLKQRGGASADSWYMVTNGADLPKIDAATASYAELEAFFRSLATMPLAANEPLREMLTTAHPPALHLAAVRPPITAVPGTPVSEPAGYASSNVGAGSGGHTATDAAGRVTLLAMGPDIFNANDGFRFVSRPAGTGAVDERATILSFPQADQWSKAGVMARWGEGPAAAMAMVNAFPDGTIALVTRTTTGAEATETKVSAGVSWPVELRLQVIGGTATGTFRTPGGPWQTIGTGTVNTTGEGRVGLAACSHVDGAYVPVQAVLGSAADGALSEHQPSVAAGTGLKLINASFASAARGWNRWGDGLSAADAGVAYEPPAGGGPTGLWQDVAVEPGKRYSFAVSAAQAAGTGTGGTVELRLESVAAGGELTLNGQTYDLSHLPATGQLHVGGTAQTDRMRILIVFSTPAATAGRTLLRSAQVTPVMEGD